MAVSRWRIWGLSFILDSSPASRLMPEKPFVPYSASSASFRRYAPSKPDSSSTPSTSRSGWSSRPSRSLNPTTPLNVSGTDSPVSW